MKIVELVQIKKCYGVLRKLLKQKNVTVYDRSAKRFRSISIFFCLTTTDDGLDLLAILFERNPMLAASIKPDHFLYGSLKGSGEFENESSYTMLKKNPKGIALLTFIQEKNAAIAKRLMPSPVETLPNGGRSQDESQPSEALSQAAIKTDLQQVSIFKRSDNKDELEVDCNQAKIERAKQ